jgi:hypothetical protein
MPQRTGGTPGHHFLEHSLFVASAARNTGLEPGKDGTKG